MGTTDVEQDICIALRRISTDCLLDAKEKIFTMQWRNRTAS
jgi:hypothetical protein